MTHEAMELARQFIADPDKRAQVKVALCVAGFPLVADMIDEAVIVSRALLAPPEVCTWPKCQCIESMERGRECRAAPPAGERKRKPTLTYPPEPLSWVAIKGDQPVVVVEKAAYDDLRARYAALVESNHSELAGGDR